MYKPGLMCQYAETYIVAKSDIDNKGIVDDFAVYNKDDQLRTPPITSALIPHLQKKCLGQSLTTAHGTPMT